MRHFFAPVVLEALANRQTEEVLEPREADLSVMFCDLRGFSKASEQDSSDLLHLLARVSDALGVMTRHILDCRGVIGDFHGDAAMGFWGWPLEQDDASIRAAEAAMRIRVDYRKGSEVGGFRCGIGIATGRAVAGRIGTVDQVKVTAFGPVVNLASRLEGMTKTFGVEVIVDDATRTAILQHNEQLAIEGTRPASAIRLRRLGIVRPKGFENAFGISEILPHAMQDNDLHQRLLTDEQIQGFEASLDAFQDGRWEDAYEQLHSLPAWDRPKDVLMSTILKHNRTPPPAWDGTVLGW